MDVVGTGARQVAAVMVRIAQSAMSASGAEFRQMGLMLSRNFQSPSSLVVGWRFLLPLSENGRCQKKAISMGKMTINFLGSLFLDRPI